jgi:hypothetical protein
MTFSISSLLSSLHPYKPSTVSRVHMGVSGWYPGWYGKCHVLISMYETTPWYVIRSLYPVYICMKQHHGTWYGHNTLYTVVWNNTMKGQVACIRSPACIRVVFSSSNRRFLWWFLFLIILFDIERTWWRLFKKSVMRTECDNYTFIIIML